MPFNYQGPKVLVDTADERQREGGQRERETSASDWCSVLPASLATDVSLGLINPAKAHSFTPRAAV